MCTEVEPILLPYQREWIADRSEVKVCEKSRRVGITWASALESVIVASADESRGGMNVYFMTTSEEDSKEFIRDCETWARVFGVLHGGIVSESADMLDDEPIIVGGRHVSVQVLKIVFKGGFRIVALAGRPQRFRGKQGLAIIDEGAHVDDLDELMAAATAFTMWGGRIAVISTHAGDQNPFNKLVERAGEGKADGYSLHSIPLKYAIEQGLAKRIAAKKGEDYSEEWELEWERRLRAKSGEFAGQELDCIPSRQGAGYFDPTSVAQCRTKGLTVLRWKKEREWGDLPTKVREKECNAWIAKNITPFMKAIRSRKGTCLGLDFARYTDGSVWVVGQMDGSTVQCLLTLELYCIPIRQQEQILGALIKQTPRFARAYMDSTGNGFALHEWARENFGRICEGFNLGPKWHDESWPILHKAITERAIDIPDDDDCAADFRLIEMVDGKPRVAKRRSRGRHGEMRHGDFAVASALMLAASKGLGSRASASVGPSSRSSRHGF